MSIETERAVIGATLLDPESSLPLIGRLSENDFLQPKHRVLFKAIENIKNNGKVPDVNTVISQLESDRKLTKAGGRVEILRMTEDAVSAALLPQYIKELKDNALKEQIAELGDELKGGSIDDVKSRLARLMSLLTPAIEEEPIHGSDTNFDIKWKLGDHYIIAQVRRLKEHSEGKVTARLDIISTFPIGPKYLYQGIFNFLAPRSQTTLINTLADRLPALDKKTWENLIIGMCHDVLRVLDEGNPTTLIEKADTEQSVNWIINPLIPRSDPVVFYGAPGSGKSYFVQAVGLLLALGDGKDVFDINESHRVLYLDWETSSAEISRRLTSIATGLGVDLPTFFYRRCVRSLEADVERIRNVIIDNDIDFVIIDSLGPACGADLNSPEPAIAFFNALRSFNLPAIITAHSPKNASETSIYGSVFFEALARTVYEVGGYHSEDDNLYVTLYHRKSNLGRLNKPIAFRFTFNGNAVSFAKEDIHNVPGAKQSLPDRIRELLLDAGKLSAEDIAEDLGVSLSRVRVALSRMRSSDIVVRLSKNNWAVKVNEDISPF